MLPVPGTVPCPLGLGIGTASAFRVTVGVAEATPGSARTARPRTARQVDALRISFSPLLMDSSASIRVAPEPCRSGDIEIPCGSPGNSGDLPGILPAEGVAYKL